MLALSLMLPVAHVTHVVHPVLLRRSDRAGRARGDGHHRGRVSGAAVRPALHVLQLPQQQDQVGSAATAAGDAHTSPPHAHGTLTHAFHTSPLRCYVQYVDKNRRMYLQ